MSSPIRNPHAQEKWDLAKRFRSNQTPAEAALWKCLRRNQLAGLHFRRQQIIEGFIVDFYCHTARLVVEIDGAVHEDRAEYDAERTRILMGQDLAIHRFTNDQIDADLNSVLATIQSTGLNRIAELSSPFPGTAPPFQGRGPGG